MSPRRILAILTKDLRDAWRDGRIVVLLLLPIGVGVFTALVNEEKLPTTSVAVVDQRDGGVARELRKVAGKSAKIELTHAPDAAAARKLVADEEVDVAVVVAPAGAPRADILVAQDATPAGQAIVELAPVALARAAGRKPPAQPPVEVVPAANQKPADIIGSSFDELFSILLFVAFVAMMVVPMQTAEELESGTFGALRLAATGREILAAKALAGYVFGAAGVGLTVALTGLRIDDPLLFYGAAFALIVTLVGFGLLLGLLLPNSTAINTYAGFLVTPLVFLAGAVFKFESGIFGAILDVLPFSAAVKLLADGISPQQPFGAGPLAWLVIVVWALAGYGILARIATHREL
jgi:ABC-2 type transport system permease protein